LALDETRPGSAPAGGDSGQVCSLAGRDVFFDSEGFLVDPSQWSEEMAEQLARETGISFLEETHWRVIRFLREYYLQNGRAPLHRELKKGIGMTLMEIEALFPGGIKMGARLLAGLPNPKTCGM
jgi:dissimilatory sulfite reductase related protein